MTESDKNGGFCVAGIEATTGKWFRLITEDQDTNGALMTNDLQYDDGNYCEELDCVEVHILKNGCSQIQPENIVIDTQYPLKKVRKYTLDEVLEIHPAEVHNEILGNIWPYIRDDKVDNANESLILIKATNLRLHNEQNSSGQLKRKIDFIHNFKSYESFSITDSNYNRVIRDEQIFKEGYLVISLPEICYNNRHYKCVAKIFI